MKPYQKNVFKPSVGITFEKFCVTGNNMVPATSQNIAISKIKYVLTINEDFVIN